MASAVCLFIFLIQQYEQLLYEQLVKALSITLPLCLRLVG